MPNNIPNYDATFCGKLPLHQTNLIQPHGILFVLDQSSLEVLQASENVEALIGRKAAELTGSFFDKLLDPASVAELNALKEKINATKQPVRLQFVQNGSQPCAALVHTKGGFLFVEVINPALADGRARSFLDAYQEIRLLMQETATCGDVNHFAEVVARHIRQLSGFDKVMVYSFDAEWHGTVIAEEKAEDMVSYLGLRFPASDIPKPARDLYLKNPYRFIPDSGGQPVKLYPFLNPRTHAFTDLSGCDLRSVAGVHLEYLRNMGVTASLSLRLVHNGKLWGLVSCHHRSPRYFSFEEMGFFELLAGIISTQLSVIVNSVESDLHQNLQEKLTRLVPLLNGPDNLQKAVEQHATEVLDLLNASGLAYNLNGHIQTKGQVPDSNDLHRLFYWLQVQTPEQMVHQPSLPRVFEEAADFAAVASGLLALPVVPVKGNFVVVFRPETIEEVAWGGNPNEALQFESDGRTYHPRNSFEVWRQTVRHTAREWSPSELSIAEAFRNVLTGIALRHMHS